MQTFKVESDKKFIYFVPAESNTKTKAENKIIIIDWLYYYKTDDICNKISLDRARHKLEDLGISSAYESDLIDLGILSDYISNLTDIGNIDIK